MAYLLALRVSQWTRDMTKGWNSWRATGSAVHARVSSTGNRRCMMVWNCVGGASKSASLDPSGRRAFIPAAQHALLRLRQHCSMLWRLCCSQLQRMLRTMHWVGVPPAPHARHGRCGEAPRHARYGRCGVAPRHAKASRASTRASAPTYHPQCDCMQKFAACYASAAVRRPL